MRFTSLENSDTEDRRAALRVALIYAAFGALYIIFSDRLVALLIGDVGAITWVQTVKGWCYVAVTAVLVYFLVLRDLSALRHSQRVIQAGEARYRQIVETSTEGIVTFNADEDAQVTFVNARLAEMLGYTPEELVGRRMWDFVDEAWRAVVQEKRRIQAFGQANCFEVMLRRRDGRELWVLVSASPLLNNQGERVATLGMLADITERKRLDEQLRQAQKMEAVGQLAGGVAHDFNNILTAILGHVDLMRSVLKGGQAVPALDDSLDQTERSAQRAAALTRQLLAFSRRQIIKPEILDLRLVLGGVERLLQRLIREDINLQIECPADVWPVSADAGQLEQVLVNLAVNARDAMPSGGRLTLAAANVTLDADYVARHADAQPGPHVELAVSDTGSGIAPEVLPHIFEPFFTSKPAGVGTGLGLATVDGIIRHLGGHIVVDTVVGRGTTFRAYVPAMAEVVRPAAPSLPRAVVPDGQETVLVCEDDATVRQLVCGALAEHGYHVVETAAARQAVEWVAGHAGPPDLLITDVVMTDMNGLELAHELQRRYAQLKVLFISGYPAEVIARQGVLNPGIEFLAKPFHSGDLLRRVREILDRRPAETTP